jgi:hypothetical protein
VLLHELLDEGVVSSVTRGVLNDGLVSVHVVVRLFLEAVDVVDLGVVGIVGVAINVHVGGVVARYIVGARSIVALPVSTVVGASARAVGEDTVRLGVVHSACGAGGQSGGDVGRSSSVAAELDAVG